MLRKTWPVSLRIFWRWKGVGKALLLLNNARFTHELHDEVEFIGGLEGVGESDQKGMIDVLEDHLLCLCVLDLILFDYVVLVDRFHSEEFFRVFLLDQ